MFHSGVSTGLQAVSVIRGVLKTTHSFTSKRELFDIQADEGVVSLQNKILETVTTNLC